MDHSFSDKLLLQPLFQGFSRLDFLDVVEKVPLEFRSFKKGETIVEQDQECQRLVLVLEGAVWSSQDSAAHTYRYAERFSAPCMLQPECIFGLHNRYTRRVVADSTVHVVAISKQNVFTLMHRYLTFQVNLLNTVCTEAQYRARILWQHSMSTLPLRFRMFLLRRSLSPKGQKRLTIRMEDLAAELGTTRLNVSRMLRSMKAKGLLTHSRGVISIEALERL